MQITTKTSRMHWATPAAGVAGGLIYRIAFSPGGQPAYGLIAQSRPSSARPAGWPTRVRPAATGSAAGRAARLGAGLAQRRRSRLSPRAGCAAR
jgi:hypothetical protein